MEPTHGRPGALARGLAALAAVFVCLAACSGGSSSPPAPPGPEFPNGLWEVRIVGDVDQNDPSLSPLPLGSTFAVVDSQFALLRLGFSGPVLDVGRDALEQSIGAPFEAYENVVAGPPAGRLGYGWDRLDVGGDSQLELFTITWLTPLEMVIDHDFAYVPEEGAAGRYLTTSYHLYPVDPYLVPPLSLPGDNRLPMGIAGMTPSDEGVRSVERSQ